MKSWRPFTWSKIFPMYRPNIPITNSSNPPTNQMLKIVVVYPSTRIIPTNLAKILYAARRKLNMDIPNPKPTAMRSGLLEFDIITSKLSLSNLPKL